MLTLGGGCWSTLNITLPVLVVGWAGMISKTKTGPAGAPWRTCRKTQPGDSPHHKNVLTSEGAPRDHDYAFAPSPGPATAAPLCGCAKPAEPQHIQK